MTYGSNVVADISSYINNIHEAAVLVARANNFIVSLVTPFYDNSGTAARDRSEYGTATFRAISDADDLAGEKFTPSVQNTLTPGEFGDQFFMTDTRVRTDIFGVMADASRELGQGAAKKVQTDILSSMSSFTGGTVGTAGGTLTWGNVFAAVTILNQQKAPGPYYGVLQSGQWYHLGTVAVPAGAQTNAPVLQDEIVRAHFVGYFFGVNWFQTPDIASGTAAVGGIFNREALAYDERVAFNIEPQRDASRRGTELNATMQYAQGVWRPKFGVQLVGTSVVPTS